jgi:hypothetical protein
LRARHEVGFSARFSAALTEIGARLIEDGGHRGGNVNEHPAESDIAESERAATIASLWAALTAPVAPEDEAGVFLLMFGPWGKDPPRERER